MFNEELIDLTGFHDASDGANPHVHGTHAHVSGAPVLSGLKIDHPASVVGLFIHQPVAVCHVAGLAVAHTIAFLNGITVFLQLMHLTSEVLPLIDPHAEVSPVLYLGGKMEKNIFSLKYSTSSV